ncbi:MAG TPA: M23 family peptidase, partial [Ruminococcus flavefaciens]|nr:M23 family peptidase [Ruminococcus flavefaciens]
MKKNLFSDKHKGSKGFYAALGISAIMIGASCYYAYDQGEKLSQDFLSQNIITEENEAVNRR